MQKKILIADDEKQLLDLMESILQEEGYKVIKTDSAEEIFSLISSENPDLLILDIVMPGIDGYSLQMALSNDPRYRNLPIILITAFTAGKALFEKFTQVKAFIQKPFTKEILLNNIRQILR